MMKLIQDKKQYNSYTISGLTMGKVLSILHAVDAHAKRGNPVAYDVYFFLKNHPLVQEEQVIYKKA